MKTFLVKNLGCKVNQYEGQVIREQLEGRGLREAGTNESCDLVIVNTCTVTGEADRKSRYEIRKLNRSFPAARIIATGCYAERDKETIRKILGVHAVVGQREKSRLLDYVDHWLSESSDAHSMQRKELNLERGISRFPGRARAFIKIQDGCNKACTFCKVVIVRGGLRSRPADSIIQEARRVLAAGYREIVLTGIQLGAYGKDAPKNGALVDLMRRLVHLEGLKRLRLSSINPYDISDGLIEFLAGEPKCCSHLHIPLQSGSNRILALMKRGYEREEYFERVEKLRRAVPEFQLTLDCMAGFPGESESDFNETLEALKYLKPLKIHAFPYSPRSGTKANGFLDQLPKDIVKQRMKRILNLGVDMRQAGMREYLGRQVTFLVEEFDEETETVKGITSNYLPIAAESRLPLLGEIVNSSVKAVRSDLLIASLIGSI
ncbi:MAG: tRNA (N(6)-L-threonylcarbamoyladenosine(37)-C(2))-methylthiotransferase MtaB [Candidatus Omnitrophica bacterium]|nr:tRNA (N(6)-L-threonylcarbamoyladenosine(37)-C(2))-methylthiotransferase MtaB [Candidatus Omnitrophota bacterium]